jgi:hypothetical protein
MLEVKTECLNEKMMLEMLGERRRQRLILAKFNSFVKMLQVLKYTKIGR